MADENLKDKEAQQLAALEQTRILEQREREEAAARENQKPLKPEIKRMGIGVFLIGLILIMIEIGVDWSTFGAFGWLVEAPLNLIVWLLKRPYRESLREANLLLNIVLAVGWIPFVDLVADWAELSFWIFALIKSRSTIVQRATARL